MKITERSFNSKYSAYYIDGNLIKSYENIQKGLKEQQFIEKLDLKTGERRYLNYSERKWLRKTE